MNRRTRTLIVMTVAIILASAAAFMVYRSVQRIPVREIEVAHVNAVVASKAIPIGTMLTKDMVKVVPWPGRNAVPGSFKAVEEVVNRGVISALAENEPVVEGKLAPIGAGAGLAPTIPSGMRAVSVKVNEVVGVAGFVVPGSRVDLVVTVEDPNTKSVVTRSVVSNIEVLTAGTRFDQEQSRADGKPIQTTVVTLLATPQDAEKITLATAEGRTMLTLRNPLDTTPTETQGVRMSGLLGGPAPPPVEKTVQGRRVVVAAPQPPAPKIYTVEAIRAAKRTEEPIR
ncbi:MAG TPA: Flp pilus assembly protein CpaB [Vicinamibacterales bacterium]|nr:Flp pilus assembly protein CpaB [Vicinamibacterales bacterium]